MNKFWGHLKTITHHRHLVMRGCFRMGLIWQGLTHDLSKYSPTEFLAGVRYYQGDRSPNTAERPARHIRARPIPTHPRCSIWTGQTNRGSCTRRP